MVGQEAVKVTVVVVICKIHSPALLIQNQTAFFSHLCPRAVAIIHPDLIYAARIEGVVHKLAAFGDDQINVSIVVEITKNGPVVSAVVRVWIVGEVVVRQVNEGGIDVQVAAIALPHARQCIIVATEGIELTVVINVGKVARLHEHGTICKVHVVC